MHELEVSMQFTDFMQKYWWNSFEWVVHLHIFRQNSASGREFERCPCVRGGSWSRGTYTFHPQCRCSGRASGGERYTLHPRAQGKLSNHNDTGLASPLRFMNPDNYFSTASHLYEHLFNFSLIRHYRQFVCTAVVWGSTRKDEDCPRWHTHLQNGPRIPSQHL